ncbi:MAG: hypothetical protein K2Y08_03385, partial [Alphaproteobacteria bacterium]|nr:hypothetical protein [Alphaproteobacteria bacterium]
RSLPDYMIPSFFVYIDKIPLTPNGKLDRKALLLINIFGNKNISFINPFNHVQLSLLKIWKQILKTEEISINHNFFEIGGNSILAIRLVEQIQRFFSKKISFTDIFKNPTIYSFSKLLESSSTNPFESPIIPVRIGNEEPTLFLVHPGGGLAFCYTGLAPYIKTPIYGINNPHFSNPEDGFNSLEEIGTHYVKLIKEIQKKGPYYLGGWSFGGLVALEISHQLALQQEEVKRLILIDTDNPTKLKRNSQKSKNKEEEIQITPNEQDFILPQKLKDLIDRNLKACKLQNNYIPPKYEGKVFLLRAENKNKFGKKIKNRIKNHDWKRYIKHLKILDIPGDHISLFDHEYITSTADAIKFAMEEPTT